MDRGTALEVYSAIEKKTYAFRNSDAEFDDWVDKNTPPLERWPTFSVRLDATARVDRPGQIGQKVERVYRVRVTRENPEFADAPSEWKWVLDLAEENALDVEIQNSAIELR